MTPFSLEKYPKTSCLMDMIDLLPTLRLRGHNWMIFPLATVYCYLEFKNSYWKKKTKKQKNLKLLFEPIVLWKKLTGFCSFWSSFLRNRSFSNASDFKKQTNKQTKTKQNKKRKIGKGNLFLNRFSWNEMWCSVVNHNHMCHICAKGILDPN